MEHRLKRNPRSATVNPRLQIATESPRGPLVKGNNWIKLRPTPTAYTAIIMMPSMHAGCLAKPIPSPGQPRLTGVFQSLPNAYECGDDGNRRPFDKALLHFKHYTTCANKASDISTADGRVETFVVVTHFGLLEIQIMKSEHTNVRAKLRRFCRSEACACLVSMIDITICPHGHATAHFWLLTWVTVVRLPNTFRTECQYAHFRHAVHSKSQYWLRDA